MTQPTEQRAREILNQHGNWDEGDCAPIIRAMLALAQQPSSGGKEGREIASPADDEVTRAFIDGWNARLGHTDFDMALHHWMLGQVTQIGAGDVA